MKMSGCTHVTHYEDDGIAYVDGKDSDRSKIAVSTCPFSRGTDVEYLHNKIHHGVFNE